MAVSVCSARARHAAQAVASPCGGYGGGYGYGGYSTAYTASVAGYGYGGGCGGCGSYEQLPELSPQYYHVNQGPTYTGPGNFAPVPTYRENAPYGYGYGSGYGYGGGGYYGGAAVSYAPRPYYRPWRARVGYGYGVRSGYRYGGYGVGRGYGIGRGYGVGIGRGYGARYGMGYAVRSTAMALAAATAGGMRGFGVGVGRGYRARECAASDCVPTMSVVKMTGRRGACRIAHSASGSTFDAVSPSGRAGWRRYRAPAPRRWRR